jgi:hypothetical protein
MTIPDLGHCAGSGTQPTDETVKKDGADHTAVSRVCSGRFGLRSDGTISLHGGARVEDRESSRVEDEPVPGPATEA